jgi:hypothetical protein
VAVADLPVDRQRLLVVADCLLGVAQGGVSVSQVAQVVALAVAVADLPVDRQRLLEVGDGAPRVPQLPVGGPQVP